MKIKRLVKKNTVVKPRVLNKKVDSIPADAIYCGRPSKYGNPFSIGKDGNRAEVIAKHKKWLDAQPELKQEIVEELRGKSLVCFCRPLPCHCDYLLEIANKETENDQRNKE